jgi:hypothetical protein
VGFNFSDTNTPYVHKRVSQSLSLLLKKTKVVPYSAIHDTFGRPTYLRPSIAKRKHPSSFALTRALTGGPSQQETSSSCPNPNPNPWIRSHDTRGRRRPPPLCSSCRSPRPPRRQRRRQGWSKAAAPSPVQSGARHPRRRTGYPVNLSVAVDYRRRRRQVGLHRSSPPLHLPRRR